MPKKVGTRYQVFNNKAEKTTGGLRKANLKKNKQGRIVSKKASSTAKRKSNLGQKLYSGNWQKKKPVKPKPKLKPKPEKTYGRRETRKNKTKNFDSLWKDPPKLLKRAKKRKQKKEAGKGTKKLTSYFSKK